MRTCYICIPFKKPSCKPHLHVQQALRLIFLLVLWNKGNCNQYQLPANICLFQVNKWNIRKRSEICSKLTIKAPKRRLSDYLWLSNYRKLMLTLISYSKMIICYNPLIQCECFQSRYWFLDIIANMALKGVEICKSQTN